MNWNLSENEKEIMSYCWKNAQWTTGAQVWAYFNSIGKAISRQAINSYLARMTDKELLIKNGKKYIYAYTEAEFEQKKTIEILNSVYGGSTKKLFAAALTGGKQLTKEESNELIDMLNNL